MQAFSTGFPGRMTSSLTDLPQSESKGQPQGIFQRWESRTRWTRRSEELLINVAKYGTVRQATVRLIYENGVLRVVIYNGIGFNLAPALSLRAPPRYPQILGYSVAGNE